METIYKNGDKILCKLKLFYRFFVAIEVRMQNFWLSSAGVIRVTLNFFRWRGMGTRSTQSSHSINSPTPP